MGERYLSFLLQRQGKGLRRCALDLGKGTLVSHTDTVTDMQKLFPVILVAYIYKEIYMACNYPGDHQAIGDDHLIMVCYS